MKYREMCAMLKTFIAERLGNHRDNLHREPSRNSISNPSYQSSESSETLQEEQSPSQQFSWNTMQTMFLEYKGTLQPNEDLTMEAILQAKSLFDYLLVDENYFAHRIYDSIVALDKSYPDRFFLFSTLPTKTRPRDHMIVQIKKILEMHRILLQAFIDDHKQALEIINLLTISHILMKVYIVDFRLFDLALGKFFLRMNLVDSNTIQYLVAYLNTVTKYVEDFITSNAYENRKRTLMITDDGNYTDTDLNGTIARENYRQMKKWHALQLILRAAVKYREGLISSEEDGRDELEHDPKAVITLKKEEDEEDVSSETKLIRWLKRGYKYKRFKIVSTQ